MLKSLAVLVLGTEDFPGMCPQLNVTSSPLWGQPLPGAPAWSVGRTWGLLSSPQEAAMAMGCHFQDKVTERFWPLLAHHLALSDSLCVSFSPGSVSHNQLPCLEDPQAAYGGATW